MREVDALLVGLEGQVRKVKTDYSQELSDLSPQMAIHERGGAYLPTDRSIGCGHTRPVYSQVT